MATYLAGSDAKVARGLLVSITLSVTHVTIAIIIAAVSLPLVSIALGSVVRRCCRRMSTAACSG
ncbi:hypothetical protein P9272_29850 [Mesorhizobium sp. WSM4976]|uniref:hypothetical protein n=1 Tax=Mesorhizobium sp. WSM4976 TaxID=3038549 RepID=UPI0024178C8C|nr:hypothetical protein [Mesorhizobium sp. WSM4976]MDG4897747.1 hypothetical protein [Mesorhizobium sp. WSM4976]